VRSKEKTDRRIPFSEWESGRVEMRAMQTAGVGGDAAVRVHCGGATRGAESGVGAGAGCDGRVSAVLGDAGKCGVGGVVFRLEEFWRGRAGGAGGEGGGRDVDARERVAGGEEWQPTGLLRGW